MSTDTGVVPFSDMDNIDPRDVDVEYGTSFSFDRMFESFQDGRVFIYEDMGKIKEYKNMLDSDGKASSVENLLTYPIIAAPWEIKGTKGDKGEADFIREFFDSSYENGGMKTPITQIISQMNFAQTLSRAYFEKVPTIRERDGAQVYQKIAWRPQETCELVLNAQNSEIVGFRQNPVNQYGFNAGASPAFKPKLDKNGYIPILGQRAFVYIHGVWRDPIDGFSAMKVPLWCHKTKQKLRYLWYDYLEQTMLPKTTIKNEDNAKARIDGRKMASLRNSDIVVLDSGSEVDTHESSGKGATGYIEAIRWLESEMSNSVLGGFMDLTSSAASGKGSYALSADQSTLFLRTRRVVARDMARQITSEIIAPIIRWNFGPEAAIPQFVFGPLSEANEEKIMDMFTNLTNTTQATKLPTDFLEQLAVRVANIVELDPMRLQDAFDEIEKNSEDELQAVAGSVALAKSLTDKATAESTIATQDQARKAAADPAGAAGAPEPPAEGEE